MFTGVFAPVAIGFVENERAGFGVGVENDAVVEPVLEGIHVAAIGAVGLGDFGRGAEASDALPLESTRDCPGENAREFREKFGGEFGVAFGGGNGGRERYAMDTSPDTKVGAGDGRKIVAA